LKIGKRNSSHMVSGELFEKRDNAIINSLKHDFKCSFLRVLLNLNVGIGGSVLFHWLIRLESFFWAVSATRADVGGSEGSPITALSDFILVLSSARSPMPPNHP